MSPSEFPEFLKIISGRDDEALHKLLAWLDPWMRAVIRARLAGHRLSGGIGVSDILQSLMKDFLNRANRDADSSREIHMERYLAAAVEMKIRAKFRKERRSRIKLSEWPNLEASGPSAEEITREKDLTAAIRLHLDARSQRLFDLRMEGYAWPEMSELIGGNPDALRMRLRRSVAAALWELDPQELTDRE